MTLNKTLKQKFDNFFKMSIEQFLTKSSQPFVRNGHSLKYENILNSVYSRPWHPTYQLTIKYERSWDVTLMLREAYYDKVAVFFLRVSRIVCSWSRKGRDAQTISNVQCKGNSFRKTNGNYSYFIYFYLFINFLIYFFFQY